MKNRLTRGCFFRSLHVYVPMALRSLCGIPGRSTSSWVRYSWSTANLPVMEIEGSPDPIRPALREEAEEVLKVLLTSTSMDSGWNNALAGAEAYFRGAVTRLFNEGDPLCLVVPKGNRLIAASLLDPDPEAALHLVSGPAVLMEYRNRGIGTRLLHASLCALRDRGILTAAGITRVNTTTSRYVYPKFKGVGEAVQLDPVSGVSGWSGNSVQAKV